MRPWKKVSRQGRNLVHRSIRSRINPFKPIIRVETREPAVALTFDDGPHPEYTPRLVEILQRHDARATFFMVGQAAQAHAEILRSVVEAGHAIGNHSWDHPSFPAISASERRWQIRACEAAIAPYGQALFRPPKGHHTLVSHLDAVVMGYQVVTWNVVAYDWQLQAAEWMTGRLLERVGPGSIVLLHDTIWDPVVAGVADRTPVLDAVDRFLAARRDRFRFVTLPELFQLGRPVVKHWHIPDDEYRRRRAHKRRGASDAGHTQRDYDLWPADGAEPCS